MGFLVEFLRSHDSLVETRQQYCFVLKGGPTSEVYGVPCLRVLQTRDGFSLRVVFRSVYADTEWVDLPDYLKQSDLYSIRGAASLWGINDLVDTEENFIPVILEALKLLNDIETLEILAGLSNIETPLFWHPV